MKKTITKKVIPKTYYKKQEIFYSDISGKKIPEYKAYGCDLCKKDIMFSENFTENEIGQAIEDTFLCIECEKKGYRLIENNDLTTSILDKNGKRVDY